MLENPIARLQRSIRSSGWLTNVSFDPVGVDSASVRQDDIRIKALNNNIYL